jgi:predicted DNA-binding transcriptional regulator
MITQTKNNIVSYIKKNRQARVNELVRVFGLSQVAIHKQLKRLTQEGILQKIGSSPHVLYVITKDKTSVILPEITKDTERIINDNYLYISPQGELLYGKQGFIRWLQNTNQINNITALSKAYIKIRQQYDSYRRSQGWIEATFKLKNTFPNNYVNKLLYADFYSVPQFGKTKLGTLVLYAKQSQNQRLMSGVSTTVQPMVQKIIKHFNIQAVAYIPASIPRKIQFMNEFKINLNIGLPQINLIKTKTGEVIVAQKSLEKLEERIINARNTIFVHSQTGNYKNILLIDDAVGSGASMNEVAKKIIEAGIAKKIIGFAIVGSFKGFEVIREI